jgi:hypothetical protein
MKHRMTFEFEVDETALEAARALYVRPEDLAAEDPSEWDWNTLRWARHIGVIGEPQPVDYETVPEGS